MRRGRFLELRRLNLNLGFSIPNIELASLCIPFVPWFLNRFCQLITGNNISSQTTQCLASTWLLFVPFRTHTPWEVVHALVWTSNIRLPSRPEWGQLLLKQQDFIVEGAGLYCIADGVANLWCLTGMRVGQRVWLWEVRVTKMWALNRTVNRGWD